MGDKIDGGDELMIEFGNGITSITIRSSDECRRKEKKLNQKKRKKLVKIKNSLYVLCDTDLVACGTS